MKNRSFKKLIFIYNADSGLRNAVLDSAHKIFSPSTYECSLCKITYGAFTEDNIWKRFRKDADVEMEFLHKDEFAARYKSKFGYKFTFPIVLNETASGQEVFVKTEELNRLENAKELIEIINARITALN